MADKVKKRPTLVVLVSIGAVGVILVGLFLVGIDTKNVAEEVVKARAELKMGIDQLDKLAQLREESKLAQSRIGSLENLLPSRDELFSFPTRVETLAANQGLSARFTFGSEGDGSIDYSLDVQGLYGEIVNFLDSIEKNMPFMNVAGTDIIIAGEEYRASISGKVFFDE